ncbi:MAG: adenine deaminase C-terminal domain-containing protein, partial [Desulfatiglandales bacterium]
IIGALKLPVGGIMSNETPEVVAKALKNLHMATKAMGCKLSSPFTTLSFLSLLVIPELRLSDLGLFDVESFGFTGLFASN